MISIMLDRVINCRRYFILILLDIHNINITGDFLLLDPVND